MPLYTRVDDRRLRSGYPSGTWDSEGPTIMRTTYAGSRILSVIVLIWLVAGLLAAGQRGYFNTAPNTCPGLSTLAVTVLAGPFNYMGMNPQVGDCDLPQPSQ